MTRSSIQPITLACLLAIAGCELAYEPDVGELSAEATDAGTASTAARCEDSDPTTDVSFARDIRPLLTKSSGGCSCHGSSAASSLNLSSYDSLRRGGQTAGARIVVPGKPCESVLVQKVGQTPPFGSRMPLNGPPYFTAEELTRLRDWVAEGAKNN
jgi:hypothetical protein